MGDSVQGKVCSGKDCGKPAKQQCPSCVKIGHPELLTRSYFCSQECFKANWPTHKQLHKQCKERERETHTQDHVMDVQQQQQVDVEGDVQQVDVWQVDV